MIHNSNQYLSSDIHVYLNFRYKGIDGKETVTRHGYEEYISTDKNKVISHVAVLAFPNVNLHCIMPVFLIEIQASKFTRKTNEEGADSSLLKKEQVSRCGHLFFFSTREIYVQSTNWYEIRGIYTLH